MLVELSSNFSDMEPATGVDATAHEFNNIIARKMLDARYWMLDTRCWILDIGYWIGFFMLIALLTFNHQCLMPEAIEFSEKS